MPAMTQQHRALHGHDDRRRAQRGRGVRRRAPHEPGDVLIVQRPVPRSAPTSTTSCFIRPVFHDGRDRRASSTCRRTMLDMGGVVPGGFAGDQAERLRERPRDLAAGCSTARDEPVKATWSLIFDNVRFGGLLLPDMQTICAEPAPRRAAADGDGRALRRSTPSSARCATSATRRPRRCAQAVTELLPDGVCEGEDTFDADGVDDSEEVPDPGQGHQARRPRRGRLQRVVAPGAHDASTPAGWTPRRPSASRSSTCSTRARRSRPRAYRDIDIVLPEGTRRRTRSRRTAPIFLYWESAQALRLRGPARARPGARASAPSAATTAALDIHNANGVLAGRHARGCRWPSAAASSGPWGATRHGDADSYQVFYLANGLDPATEAIESDVPAVVLRQEYAPDTARRGLQPRRARRCSRTRCGCASAHHFSMPLRLKRPSGIGVNGGERRADAAGSGCSSRRRSTSPSEKELAADRRRRRLRDVTPVAGVLDPDDQAPDPRRRVLLLRAACPIVGHQAATPIFRYLTNGGGGFGDPARARARAGEARRARRLRDDRGRAARLRRRRRRRSRGRSRGPGRRPRGDRAGAGRARRMTQTRLPGAAGRATPRRPGRRCSTPRSSCSAQQGFDATSVQSIVEPRAGHEGRLLPPLRVQAGAAARDPRPLHRATTWSGCASCWPSPDVPAEELLRRLIRDILVVGRRRAGAMTSRSSTRSAASSRASSYAAVLPKRHEFERLRDRGRPARHRRGRAAPTAATPRSSRSGSSA